MWLCQACIQQRKHLLESFKAVSRSTKRHASQSSLQGRPFRVGIVGGGPAGFYAASRLLDLRDSAALRVDLFELLPVPFGLSRFGVAPDHPEVKVTRDLRRRSDAEAEVFRMRRIANTSLKRRQRILAFASSGMCKFPVTLRPLRSGQAQTQRSCPI